MGRSKSKLIHFILSNLLYNLPNEKYIFLMWKNMNWPATQLTRPICNLFKIIRFLPKSDRLGAIHMSLLLEFLSLCIYM